MPSPSIVSSSSQANTSGGSSDVDITAPASIVSGNLLVAIIYSANNDGKALGAPRGWEEVSSNIVHAVYGNLAIFQKIANSIDEGASDYNFTGDTYMAGAIIQISNATGLDVAPVYSTTTASGTAAVIPAITPSNSNDLYLGVVGTISGTSGTTPGGLSLVTSNLSSGNEGISVYSESLSSSATIGPFTSTLGGSDNWAAVALVVSTNGKYGQGTGPALDLTTVPWASDASLPWHGDTSAEIIPSCFFSTGALSWTYVYLVLEQTIGFFYVAWIDVTSTSSGVLTISPIQYYNLVTDPTLSASLSTFEIVRGTITFAPDGSGFMFSYTGAPEGDNPKLTTIPFQVAAFDVNYSTPSFTCHGVKTVDLVEYIYQEPIGGTFSYFPPTAFFRYWGPTDCLVSYIDPNWLTQVFGRLDLVAGTIQTPPLGGGSSGYPTASSSLGGQAIGGSHAYLGYATGNDGLGHPATLNVLITFPSGSPNLTTTNVTAPIPGYIPDSSGNPSTFMLGSSIVEGAKFDDGTDIGAVGGTTWSPPGSGSALGGGWGGSGGLGQVLSVTGSSTDVYTLGHASDGSPNQTAHTGYNYYDWSPYTVNTGCPDPNGQVLWDIVTNIGGSLGFQIEQFGDRYLWGGAVVSTSRWYVGALGWGA